MDPSYRKVRVKDRLKFIDEKFARGGSPQSSKNFGFRIQDYESAKHGPVKTIMSNGILLVPVAPPAKP